MSARDLRDRIKYPLPSAWISVRSGRTRSQASRQRGGVRSPELAAPLAAYTGWNLRDASIGATYQLVSFEATSHSQEMGSGEAVE
jgi:hypothetical protein